MGDNERKLDADDIYELVTENQAKVVLPCFVAENRNRIPSINPSEAGVCTLAASIRHLKEKVA